MEEGLITLTLNNTEAITLEGTQEVPFASIPFTLETAKDINITISFSNGQSSSNIFTLSEGDYPRANHSSVDTLYSVPAAEEGYYIDEFATMDDSSVPYPDGYNWTILDKEIIDLSYLLNAITAVGKTSSNSVNLTFPHIDTIPNSAFEGCEGYYTITLSAATNIGNCAFKNNSGLISVEMPEVEIVGYEAFYGCKILNSVALPKLCGVLERGVLQDCGAPEYLNLGSNGTGLTGVVFDTNHLSPLYATTTSSCTLYIKFADRYTDSFATNSTLTLSDSNNTEDIEFFMINDNFSIYIYSCQLSDFTSTVGYPTESTWYITDYDATAGSSDKFTNLTTVPSSAFNNSSFKDSYTVNIDLRSVTSISSSAFKGFSLKELLMPNVATISNSAFRNAKISEINGPEVTSIGTTGNTTISSGVFRNATINSISLPKVTSIGGYAFAGASELTTLDLGSEGDGVNAVGQGIFDGVSTENIELKIKLDEEKSSSTQSSISYYTLDDEANTFTAYSDSYIYTFLSINGEFY